MATSPAPSTETITVGPVRCFECKEDDSSKFWQISIGASEHTVRYGRLGTVGQCKTKQFPNPEAAVRDAAKLIAEKLKKGYVEVTATEDE
jgi:predicted DNA-binding WGR domain protein